MTSNKPEAVAYRYTASRSFRKRNPKWHYQESFPHAENRKVEEIGLLEKLIRLSDYEALQAECEKLRTELDRYKTSTPALLLFSKVPRYRVSKGPGEDGWGRSTVYIRVDEDPTGEFMRTDEVRRLLIQPLLEQTK